MCCTAPATTSRICSHWLVSWNPCVLDAFALLGRSGGQHLVVQADDCDAEKRDGVIDAEHCFAVDINVKEFVQRREISHAPMIWTAIHDPIKSRPAKSRSRRVQSERSIRMRDRTQINIRAAPTRKRHLHTGIFLAWN